MGRHSSVDQKLTKTKKRKLQQRREEGCTLDQIMTKEKLEDHGVSRSALGRYMKKTERIAAKMRQQRAMAEVIVSSQRTDLDSKSARLNVQLVHSVITDIMAALKTGETLKPAEAAAIAKALDSLARVERQDLDLVERLKAQAKAEAEAAARARLEAMLPKGDRDPSEMSDEELDQAILNAIRK